MKKMIIGIDPGVGGGIAIATDPYSPLHVDAAKMPDTPKGIYDYLRSIIEGVDEPLCYVERVGTYRPGNSAVSACTFAKHTGVLEMALIALQIPSYYVIPHKWMKEVMGAVPKDKGDRKRAIKSKMEQLYPHLRVTLATADALGILTYGIQQTSVRTS